MSRRLPGDNLYWLLTDHLGGTNVTLDSAGTRLTELRYYPFGDTRYNPSSQLTNYRFTGQWMDYGPNLAVFQLCYNDVLRIKPEDVAANLKKMIDAVLAAPGGRAVVLTPLSYDKKRVDETLAKGTDINKVHSEQYIPALKKLVADYEADPKTKGRVAFVNIWEAMAKVRAEKGADYVLLPDGSHPNAEGHKLLADTVWPELKRLAEAVLKDVEEKP